jgi:hypothetical protein
MNNENAHRAIAERSRVRVIRVIHGYFPMRMKRTSRSTVLWIVGLLLLSGCGRLDSIPYQPRQTPETWLAGQPFLNVKIGAEEIILVQPSSTVLVYLLGIVAIGVGLVLWRIRDTHRSRLWWGIALLLWGVGALCAGTSYQAFSYEIKCVGREVCAWTSWWEVIYLILSAASVDAMVGAVACSCAVGKWRQVLSLYALLNAALYTVVVLVGALIPVKFLISFELLILVAAPNILILFVLNGWRYYKHKNPMDLALLGAWLWLGLTLGAYFVYLVLDVTPNLWARGVWFSENDVLHIGLILWMLYIALVLAKRVVDAKSSLRRTVVQCGAKRRSAATEAISDSPEGDCFVSLAMTVTGECHTPVDAPASGAHQESAP